MVSRMRPEIDFAGRAIQGQREDQEDYLAFEQLGGRTILVLADGAGGQAAGEHASRNAVLGFLECFAQSHDAIAPTLFAALHEGNRRVAAFMGGAPAERAAMATTLLAAVIEERALHWISVGDSPLLLFRAGRLQRLNADHSIPDPSGGVPGENNILRSALGGGMIAMIDWRREAYELEDGDLILAASDGLWTLSLPEIAAHLAVVIQETATVIANELLRLVKTKARMNQD
ncbi:MAG TPA: protein phosphatase 2C domain-containing protein, partial [Candidatus Methylacidiphilales bacterium]|nr:protein phosphatase 2C domain-containing protein [Candidatus Methylacidiphilales bacterium]